MTSRNKWDKVELNYWYNPDKMTGDLPIETIKRETEESLQMWADRAGVTFKEVMGRELITPGLHLER